MSASCESSRARSTIAYWAITFTRFHVRAFPDEPARQLPPAMPVPPESRSLDSPHAPTRPGLSVRCSPPCSRKRVSTLLLSLALFTCLIATL